MNVTGKESYSFDKEELLALAEETDSPRFPDWVSRGLREQANVVPEWVEESAERFLNITDFSRGGWERHDDRRYSTTVAIHYPTGYFNYYVVDRIQHPSTGDGWDALEGTYYIEALAHNAARKKTYETQVPHRVRLVVWDG